MLCVHANPSAPFLQCYHCAGLVGRRGQLRVKSCLGRMYAVCQCWRPSKHVHVHVYGGVQHGNLLQRSCEATLVGRSAVARACSFLVLCVRACLVLLSTTAVAGMGYSRQAYVYC